MKNLGNLYLENLGIKDSELTVDTLNAIVNAHLSNYSFNNLEVLLNKGEILSLELEDLYKKVVTSRDGGYCFEHNKLVYYVLKDLGFDATSYLGRVVYGRDVDAPRTHRTTIVKVENAEYLLDVGFGPYSPMCIIPLSGETVVDPCGTTYRVVKKNEREFQLEALRDGEYFTLYVFDLGIYQESDYMVANYYTNTYHGSKFVNELIVSIKKDGTIYLVSNFLFSKLLNGEREDFEIDTADKMSEILKDFFDLETDVQKVKSLLDAYLDSL
ncbi:hypothetical protein A9Q84_14865 [Halobacteriovorax marinus]|uniref:Arylamine N-acetyltransferase n=1 Tax=Halobacteriovorax marinus TaxID=97084 RepID=A0A1Y5F540_9BACT|nr:hypothetical protein A9Q84_14865 [Halobacteriovorax marinus]